MFKFFGKKKAKEDIDSDDVDVDLDEEETEEGEEKKKKFFRLNKILKPLIFIIIIGVILFGVVKLFLSKDSNETKNVVYVSANKLTYVEIENKVLLFTYENSPSLYKKILDVNSALQTVSNEINRIEDIKFKYPKYTSIINPEIVKLKKIKNSFDSAFLKVKNGIEKIYVITIINKEKGEQTFKMSAVTLIETLNSTLIDNKNTLFDIKRSDKKEKTFFVKVKSFIQNTLYQ